MNYTTLDLKLSWRQKLLLNFSDSPKKVNDASSENERHS